jgi:spore coat polysaccharide biosynthesis predicted glycosyltransferase SpsG
MRKKSIVMRLDVGHEVGTGHWARCSALASWLMDFDVDYVVAADAEGQWTVAGRERVTCLPLDQNDDVEMAWWRGAGHAADAVIFDFSYPARVASRDATRMLVSNIGGTNCRRILIDGIGSQTLVENDDWPLDAVVVPYVGAHTKMAYPTVMLGTEFFILPSDLGPPPRRSAAGPVHRVLVTMGGSDPRGLTLRVLDAFARMPTMDLRIDVVVGPAFAVSLAETIRARASSDARVRIIDAPASLAKYLTEADLAVTATGLTKYEVAWAGVPAVQISTDRLNAEVNRSFEREGVALHLGAADEVDAASIAKAISNLAADTTRRDQMTRRGQTLVDGRGGERIAQYLRTLLDVAT